MQPDPPPLEPQYVVVARRYRPQAFSDLVGQTQVAVALSNAIEQNRVGHAYLFTGGRGVGKTSTARIFAKCLNCHQGSTVEPCHECDICQSIATGEDVDVIEIDGASNRGIDEIRQLRSNANVRPSRARFKIYIIDEVHMLTAPAFNALLKTLEEPPEHVKFIFCTTDPEKIPITVLSRCQRFDFPPIQTESIKERLRLIVSQEEISAEDAALELLARRAEGSMRDSQSLLEQLLSFASTTITVADVNAMLGTADASRVLAIVQSIVEQNPQQALLELNQTISAGVDAGQLIGQLLGVVRDLMAVKVGCPADLLMYTSRDDLPQLRSICETMDLEKIMAILQVIDQSLIKARYSNYVRTLLEMAVVRASHLENIELIPQLVAQLRSGTQPSAAASPTHRESPPSPTAKPARKKNGPVKGDAASAPPAPPKVKGDKNLAGTAALEPEKQPRRKIEWDESNLDQVWRGVLQELGDMTADVAGNFESLKLSGRDRLIVVLKSAYDRDLCCRPERKSRLEQAIEESTGKRIRLDFEITDAVATPTPSPAAPLSRRQRQRQLEQTSFVRKAIELFDAEIVDIKSRPPR